MKQSQSAADILSDFPHYRTPLSPEYEKIYLEEIKVNRGERGGWFYRLLGKVESWMHLQIERPQDASEVLEIGAGTLNHVPFEKSASAYDIVEPMVALYQDSPNKDRVRTAYTDIADLPEDARYGRIVSTAAFEHIEELPECVARVALALEEKGMLQVSIPAEGGFLWGASWRLTTGILFRLRNKISYAPLMRFEHINTDKDIMRVIETFFSTVKVRRFPLPLRHASIYAYIEASDPKCEIAKQFLEGRQK